MQEVNPVKQTPNPYQSPEATGKLEAVESSPVSVDFAQLKRRQLLFILLVMAAWGVLSGVLINDDSSLEVVSMAAGLINIIFILKWCGIDRAERNLRRWRLFVPMMVVFPGPIVMLPIYFLVTRRLGGFAALAKAIAFLLLMALVGSATLFPTLLLTSATGGSNSWE